MAYRDNRTRNIFRFICEYQVNHGFVPTLGEIAEYEGFSSNSGVIRHLDKLEQWGWIQRHHGQARSIRILRSCEEIEDPKSKLQHPTRLSFRRR
jgi:SOS-response transcriptional repressor LexA